MNESSSSIPLYYQVATDIKSKIEEGKLIPGEKLPTENKLSDEYQVSRVTVRNALNALVESDVVEHQENKGYYVKKLGKSFATPNKGHSLHRYLEEQGFKTYSKILSMQVISCEGRMKKIFNLEDGDTLIKFNRVRYVENQPFALETNYLPFKIFEGIDFSAVEEGSLVKVMEDQFHVQIAYSTQKLKPKFPTQEEKQILELTSNGPLLYIRSKLVDTQEELLKYGEVLFRTDVVEYSFTWTAK